MKHQSIIARTPRQALTYIRKLMNYEVAVIGSEEGWKKLLSTTGIKAKLSIRDIAEYLLKSNRRIRGVRLLKLDGKDFLIIIEREGNSF